MVYYSKQSVSNYFWYSKYQVKVFHGSSLKMLAMELGSTSLDLVKETYFD